MIRYLYLLLAVLMLYSCSVQKRKYRSGFYLGWHGKKASGSGENTVAKKQSLKEPASAAPLEPQSQPALVLVEEASANVQSPVLIAKKAISLNSAPPDTCDLIIFRDGTEAQAKITEVSSSGIKYKRCDFKEGPDFSASRAKVFMIKYANGSREVFESVQETRPAPQQGSRHGTKKVLNIKALLSLIFGIIGFFGIIAIILGNLAIQEMDEQPDRYKGRLLAEIGRGIGYVKISIILISLAFLVIGLLLI